LLQDLCDRFLSRPVLPVLPLLPIFHLIFHFFAVCSVVDVKRARVRRRLHKILTNVGGEGDVVVVVVVKLPKVIAGWSQFFRHGLHLPFGICPRRLIEAKMTSQDAEVRLRHLTFLIIIVTDSGIDDFSFRRSRNSLALSFRRSFVIWPTAEEVDLPNAAQRLIRFTQVVLVPGHRRETKSRKVLRLKLLQRAPLPIATVKVKPSIVCSRRQGWTLLLLALGGGVTSAFDNQDSPA